MARTDLWKYCSAEQCREMMLSFRLIGAGDWPPEKIMGCLYALSNHAEKHYQRVNIPKRSGGFRTLLAGSPSEKCAEESASSCAGRIYSVRQRGGLQEGGFGGCQRREASGQDDCHEDGY